MYVQYWPESTVVQVTMNICGLTQSPVKCEGVLVEMWGGDDGVRGEAEGEGWEGGGEGEEGPSGSVRPGQPPRGSSYELRAPAHSPRHPPLLLSPVHVQRIRIYK